MVYANGVEYAELTTSAIQSGMLTFQRLLNTSEDARIKGLYVTMSCTKVYGIPKWTKLDDIKFDCQTDIVVKLV